MRRVSQELDYSKHGNGVAGKRFMRISKTRYPIEPNFSCELEFSIYLPKPRGHFDNIKNAFYFNDDAKEAEADNLRANKSELARDA